jgi:hypothetical protein
MRMIKGPFLTATRIESPVEWRPVIKRTKVTTDMGSELWLYPGKHVEMRNPNTEVKWGNRVEDFIRNHKMSRDEWDFFLEYYPDVEIPESNIVE